jgi:hypothetical protein
MADATPVEKVLSADDILGTKDLAPVPYDIPEWGGKVYIRQLSAAEGRELGDLIEGPQKKGTTVKIVLFGLCDASGKRIFQDHQTKAMEGKCMKVINRVSTEILKVNGLVPDKAEQKKLEDEAKND